MGLKIINNKIILLAAVLFSALVLAVLSPARSDVFAQETGNTCSGFVNTPCWKNYEEGIILYQDREYRLVNSDNLSKNGNSSLTDPEARFFAEGDKVYVSDPYGGPPDVIGAFYFKTGVDIATTQTISTAIFEVPKEKGPPGVPAGINGVDGGPMGFNPANGPSGESSDDKKESSTCKIDGVGWLVCPVVIFLGQVVDGSYSVLEGSLLTVEPVNISTSDEGNGLYKSWKIMRDFANIAFVAAFLLVVLSQVTNLGISNYGIKRILPRLVIAAILVNVSYYICAIAVDLSNIIGTSVKELLDTAVGNQLPMPEPPKFSDGSAFKGSSGWAALAGLVLAGALGTSLELMVGMSVFIPLLFAAVVAVLTVVLVLTLRQVLIILLIVISPLAFVAMLFPNTEEYFKRWRQTFEVMLLLFPIIAAIFGASALASKIIMASSDEFLVQIMGAGASIIPLLITPVVLKFAGGILNRFAGIVNNPAKGPIDGIRNNLEDKRKVNQSRVIGRTGEWVNSTSGGRVFGGANSRRRRALGAMTIYGGNNRTRARKDALSEAESDLESTYLGTEQGQQARNAAKNAQINLQNAQINTDTIRISSAEGVALQQESTNLETRKQVAENRAQTAALGALSGALVTESKESELSKQIAENTSKAAGLTGADMDLRMRAATSADRLSTVESLGKQTYEEISARGSAHPNLAALGIDDTTAADARDTRFEAKAAARATGNAGREIEIEYAREINRPGSTLADQAGGRINPQGASNARADATAVEVRAFNEAVDIQKKTMSSTPTTSSAVGPGLEVIMDDRSEPVERRAAATGMRASSGGMGEILETFNKLGRDMEAARLAGDADEVRALSAMQQQFMEDIGNRLPASVTGPAKGAMSRGQFEGTLNSEILTSLGDGKYSGEMLAGLHPRELARIRDVIASNRSSLTPTQQAQLTALQNSIKDYKKAAPSLGRGLAQEREIPITGIETI